MFYLNLILHLFIKYQETHQTVKPYKLSRNDVMYIEVSLVTNNDKYYMDTIVKVSGNCTCLHDTLTCPRASFFNHAKGKRKTCSLMHQVWSTLQHLKRELDKLSWQSTC